MTNLNAGSIKGQFDNLPETKLYYIWYVEIGPVLFNVISQSPRGIFYYPAITDKAKINDRITFYSNEKVQHIIITTINKETGYFSWSSKPTTHLFERNPMGYKELREALEFVFELTETIIKSLSDGISATDLAKFVSLIGKAVPAFRGIDQIPAEFADLDDQEADELVEYLREKFDIPNDVIEARIEQGLQIITNLGMSIKPYIS